MVELIVPPIWCAIADRVRGFINGSFAAIIGANL